ncbi:MAG: flagellar hook-length control protein FliK, partial [Enterobacteriaceae bacterium]
SSVTRPAGESLTLVSNNQPAQGSDSSVGLTPQVKNHSDQFQSTPSFSKQADIVSQGRESWRLPAQMAEAPARAPEGSASVTSSDKPSLLNGLVGSSAPVEAGGTQTQVAGHSADKMMPGSVKLDSTQGDSLPRQLNHALGERLQVQINNKVQHAEIRLDPPDMGKITVSLQMEGNRLQVNINATQSDVYRALQQVSQELRSQLTEQNFMQVNVQVSSQQQSQQQQEKNERYVMQSEQIEEAGQFASTHNSSESDDSVLIKV